MTYAKVKTITSHAGHARFLAECSEEPLGYIPTPWEIPSPYAYSASTVVWLHYPTARRIFIKESTHRHYTVYQLTDGKLMTDEQATATALLNRNNQ